MSYLDLPRPLLVLAPMEDVTDTVFRQMIQRIAPFNLYMTEFANVDGLQSAGRKSTIKRLKYEASEQPLIAQIWGSNPENYYKSALELVDMGFVGIDINMGCPVKAVMKSACGAGMIDHPEQAVTIIDAVKRAVNGRIPVSVKTRLGTRQFTPDWLETLLSQDLAMLTIHLRTAKEMSKVPAHWELMPEVKTLRDRVAPGTLLIGNGDIQNQAQAMELVSSHGIDGAMIGRGVFHDPYAAMAVSPWPDMSVAEKLDLYRQHVELFRVTWGDGGQPVAPLNKFCKTYVSGFDGAKELRESLMHAANVEELLLTIAKARAQVA